MSQILELYSKIVLGQEKPKEIKRTIQFLVMMINHHSAKMSYNLHSCNIVALLWDMLYTLQGMQLD